jgi:hypothetical protein
MKRHKRKQRRRVITLPDDHPLEERSQEDRRWWRQRVSQRQLKAQRRTVSPVEHHLLEADELFRLDVIKRVSLACLARPFRTKHGDHGDQQSAVRGCYSNTRE